MANIDFRQLAEDDLLLLFTWLSRPHVKKWYSPEPSSFAEVAAKYRPRTDEESAVKAFVIVVDGADAGYIQTYFIDEFPAYERLVGCEKGVVGLDLFLGDEWRTRHGLGPQVIRRFVDEILFGHYGALACVAGPNEGNDGSIRAFEKAGFRRWKVVVNERGEKECVLRRERDELPYRIETIDLIDSETCARFRRDMHVAAFGSEDGLEEEMGEDNALYLEQLRARLAHLPEGNAHLWHADQIVGQIEMSLPGEEPHIACVNLFYVVPERRGQGLGRRLHEHAVEVSRHRGRRAMRLSVSLSNVPAIVFYRKLGWVMAGTRTSEEPIGIMEFPLS